MEALAKLRNCPMSARKMRLVVDNIRGKNVEDALKSFPEDKALLAARKKLEADSTIADQNRVFDYAVEQEQRADSMETL